jgi:hypothetical protein
VAAAIVLSGLLAGAPVLVGDDGFTFVANQLGYEVRQLPCPANKGAVRAALYSDGRILYNGEALTATDVAARIHAGRLELEVVCIYLEDPMTPASQAAFHVVVNAISSDSLSLARFTDSEFKSRVLPKMP